MSDNRMTEGSLKDNDRMIEVSSKDNTVKDVSIDLLSAEDISKLTIEELFEKIENVLSDLENEETGVEEAFKKYNYGMNLLKFCNEKLDKVEKKVLLLSDDLNTEVFE